MDLSGQKQRVFSVEQLHQVLIMQGLKKYITAIAMVIFIYMIQEILFITQVRQQI
jgi:hypothetical protein